MMDVLSDGLLVLITYKWAILIFLICSFAMGSCYLDMLSGGKVKEAVNLSMSLPIGMTVLIGGTTCLIFILGHLMPSLMWGFSVSVLAGVAFLVSVLILRRKLTVSKPAMGFVGIAVIVLLFLRMPFLTRIILPPYSDSPIHYQIIFQLLNPNSPGYNHLFSLGNTLDSYYHYGFHGIAAWLTLVSGVDPGKVIPLIGQLFLVVLPVSIYSLAFTLTRNYMAALFSGLLSVIGWIMPAFSVNWGKYPALGSLAVAPALLAALFIFRHERKYSRTILLCFLFLSAFLIHTRLLVVFMLVSLAYYLSIQLIQSEEISVFSSIRYSLLYCISLLPLYWVLADFYNGFTVVILLSILPFAFRAYPRYSVCIFVFTFFTWAATAAPITGRILLDRQYVGMMLCIPFSIFGGLGFSGFVKYYSPLTMKIQSISVVFMGIVLLLNLPPGSLYPDECCNYFTEGDQQAITWIRESASVPSLFLISSFHNGNKNFDTDAGAWIHPLTGQPVNKLDYRFDWSSSKELDMVCRLSQKDIYVYYGGRDYSFNASELDRQGKLSLVFHSNKTRIYRVAGCAQMTGIPAWF